MPSAGARRSVIHIVPRMGVGGLPRVVETLCRTTDPERFEVGVLCLELIGEIGEDLRAQGFRVDLVPHNPDRPDRLAPLKVARYLRRHRVDVVHTHNTQAFLEGLTGAVAARVPVRIHTDHARLYPDRTAYVIAERILARFTTRVVAVSDHTAADLRRHQRIPDRLITTIPNGLDGSPFRRETDVGAKRRELGLPPDCPVIGLAARLVPQKGIDVLLDATARLRERFPTLQVLIAGYGDLEEDLKAQARTLGLETCVHFLGVRRDTPELFQVMDLFMLPSNWEGLPMAVLEAMAAGLPIVGSDVGGVATAVAHGTTGLLVPPADPEALAEAAGGLLGDPARRAAFGTASRTAFRQRFSAEAMTRAYERLYGNGSVT